MEVHRQYNLQSKKTDENSPKKVTKMKKVVESKKSPKPSSKKTPEKSNVEAPTKRNITILQRSTQTEVSSIDPPNTFGQKTMVDNQNY
jgi:hypothetical protein